MVYGDERSLLCFGANTYLQLDTTNNYYTTRVTTIGNLIYSHMTETMMCGLLIPNAIIHL